MEASVGGRQDKKCFRQLGKLEFKKRPKPMGKCWNDWVKGAEGNQIRVSALVDSVEREGQRRRLGSSQT